MKTLKDFSYNEKNNIIDITLEPITEESKAYIVDQRFINVFLQDFQSVPFSVLQTTLQRIIDNATDFESMAIGIDQFMYLHKIANHPELKKPEVKEPVTNEFRKVGKISLDTDLEEESNLLHATPVRKPFLENQGID